MKKQYVLIAVTMILLFGIGSAFGQEVSEEAKRHFDRGMAAVEMAKSSSDYAAAINEFEQAARLAPDWPDVYYNLAKVQEAAEKYGDAARSFRKYLQLAPDVEDAEEIKSLINKLEYRKEQIEGSRSIDSLKAKVTGVRFFESGYDLPAKDQRFYRTSFSRTATRFVNYELNLEHPMPGMRKGFAIESVWFGPYGNEIFRYNQQTDIKDNWTSSYHSYGYGWREASSSAWDTGIYQIDLYVNGSKIASEKFTIY